MEPAGPTVKVASVSVGAVAAAAAATGGDDVIDAMMTSFIMGSHEADEDQDDDEDEENEGEDEEEEQGHRRVLEAIHRLRRRNTRTIFCN